MKKIAEAFDMHWARNTTEVIKTAALAAIPAKIPVLALDFQDGI